MTKENEVLAVYNLQNNLLYFLQAVFIVEYPKRFHLMVIHDNHIWMDKNYSSLAAAKHAFFFQYKNKAWAPDTRPKWQYKRLFHE